MGCRLVRNIQHSCEYNSGGIEQILLLDMDDFKAYRFTDDGLYDSCFVERIRVKQTGYIELDTTGESVFTETRENGLFTQRITTFVRSLAAEKTKGLLLAGRRTYLVVFASRSGRLFSFGSDGGARVEFTQTSGALGEVEGYQVTINKKSIYPLFEIDRNAISVYLLGTEDKRDFITSEDMANLFKIEGYEY